MSSHGFWNFVPASCWTGSNSLVVECSAASRVVSYVVLLLQLESQPPCRGVPAESMQDGISGPDLNNLFLIGHYYGSPVRIKPYLPETFARAWFPDMKCGDACAVALLEARSFWVFCGMFPSLLYVLRVRSADRCCVAGCCNRCDCWCISQVSKRITSGSRLVSP